MKTNLLIPFFILMLFPGLISCTGKKEWSVDSPSGNIRFTLFLGDNNQLYYKTDFLQQDAAVPVISQSPLGLTRNDGNFITGLSFVSLSPVQTLNETLELVTGKKRRIESSSISQTFTFKNETGSEIQMVIRVFDDGVAFRYVLPGNGNERYTLQDEVTGFAIAGSGKAWIQPYDKVTPYSPAYETYYTNGSAIGTQAPSVEGWSFPALFQTGNAWILLTEAAADSSWFAAHLQQKAENGLYTLRMPEESEAYGLYSNKPASSLPWQSPWRVLIMGETLSDIVESGMVSKLNPPSAISDATWIKPGRAAWSWWSDWASPRDYPKMLPFIDLAAEMGWEYFLVDANWDIMENGNVEKLIAYATKKNIGIWLWYNSGGAHNTVTERPRDLMLDPDKRKEEFKKIAGWGVKGVKVDFFQSDKPAIIKQYQDILKDAADNGIMVNFHGCTLPRGWNRTWPNLLSMEAVRGAECYGFDSSYPEITIWHNTILPFTRNAVGSMDYTPVTFSDQKFPHITSYGYELALSIVFESGILHYADAVKPYRELPEVPKAFLSKVPVVWDETRLLGGEPGQYCIMARRSGNTWYIGGINGTKNAQTWEIDLAPLGEQDFNAAIITDGPDSRQFSTETIMIPAGEKMKVSVLPAGGFVATLNP